MRRWAALGVAVAVVSLAGCSGFQSVLNPEGDNAISIARLFWFFLTVCASIWIVVMAILAMSLVRARRNTAPETRDQRRMGFVIGGCVAASVIILVVFTLASFFTNKSIAAAPEDPLTVKVEAHQWWWQVTYLDKRIDHRFETANEIHVPVGRPILLQFESPDVIHSFWMPNLAGKQDVIPGRFTELTFTVEKPGIYRGQCAEFCGIEHAHMGMYVVAQEPFEFDKWRGRQIGDSVPPTNAMLRHGYMVFVSNACASCHTIRGTDAGGVVGPDLTHFGSRLSIAAGTVPNTMANLQGWIANPHGIKPYTQMPSVALAGDDLTAVSQYLESLK
ncbi:MAG TPA: cytochrome c oxidase subunit II [Rhizomicrobium sp.]|jgi:cytochrome c oxidase subunit 2